MKKILSLVLLITVLLAVPALGATAENEAVPSFMEGAVTYAEAEKLASALGLLYSGKEGEALFTENRESPTALSLSLADPYKATVMSFDGKIGELKLLKTYSETAANPVLARDGKLYVPFRFVAEFFGARVYFENGEARAERTKYYAPALIRTNGQVRERVSVKDGFESAVIAGDRLLYITGDKMYIRDLNSGSEEELCPAGRAHVSGDKVFVLTGGKVISADIKTRRYITLCENVMMVGYTFDDYAWCDMADKSEVYDRYGNKIATVTGDFYNAFDYAGGLVYYTEKSGALYRAKPDGSEKVFLAKAAYYPEYKDGFVYYIDDAGNFRRVSADGSSDEMIYGLNLEIAAKTETEYIYNYYSNTGSPRLFIGAADGKNFRPYSDDKVSPLTKMLPYKDGFAFVSYYGNKPYYATKSASVKLSDDEPTAMAGVYGDWVYYVVD